MDSKLLEKKLSAVKDSAEDIQALSRWCIQNKNHHHSIVHAWSRAVRKAKVPHRLTLFYVCNDIVQNSRRKKCPDLVQYFGTAIKDAVPLVRDEKIRGKIKRIFNIWEERGIYDAKLIAEFLNIAENVGTLNASENDVVLASFQLVKLVEGMRNLVALERTSACLLTDFQTQENIMSQKEISKIQDKLKERGESREKLEEFEEAVLSLECFVASLQKEIEERTKVVTLLEQAEIFYETQRGEAKVVATAYKNFSQQVEALKAKLEKEPPIASPIPSPSDFAPSPVDSDTDDPFNLDLMNAEPPPSNKQEAADVSSGFESFMGSDEFALLAKQAFSDSPEKPVTDPPVENQEYVPSSRNGPGAKHERRSSSRSEDVILIEEDVAKPSQSRGHESEYYDSKRSRRDSRDVRESRDVRDRDSRGSRDSWERDSRDVRDSRESRDSRDSSSRRRRSSSSKDRDFDILPKTSSHSKSFMDLTSAKDPSYKEPRPMGAKELFETFGKSLGSGSSSLHTSHRAQPPLPSVPPPPITSAAHPPPIAPPPLPVAAPNIPLPPYTVSNHSQPPIVPIHRSNPPLPPSYPMVPAPERQSYPMGPAPEPVPSTVPVNPSHIPQLWNQPPPPPPPPIPESEDTGDQDWNYEDEVEQDNRNWGEIPGTDELQVLEATAKAVPGLYEGLGKFTEDEAEKVVDPYVPAPFLGGDVDMRGARRSRSGSGSDMDISSGSDTEGTGQRKRKRRVPKAGTDRPGNPDQQRSRTIVPLVRDPKPIGSDVDGRMPAGPVNPNFIDTSILKDVSDALKVIRESQVTVPAPSESKSPVKSISEVLSQESESIGDRDYRNWGHSGERQKNSVNKSPVQAIHSFISSVRRGDSPQKDQDDRDRPPPEWVPLQETSHSPVSEGPSPGIMDTLRMATEQNRKPEVSWDPDECRQYAPRVPLNPRFRSPFKGPRETFPPLHFRPRFPRGPPPMRHRGSPFW